MAPRLVDHNIFCYVLVCSALRAGLCVLLSGIFRNAGRARVRHEAISRIIVPLVASSSTSAGWVSAINTVILAVDLPRMSHGMHRHDFAFGARWILTFVTHPSAYIASRILQPLFRRHGGKSCYGFFRATSEACVRRGASTTCGYLLFDQTSDALCFIYRPIGSPLY